ncbi:hypothetical protein SUGI_1188990 [Cryptomeria japonica]|nr:hypothetical protein SUGI_1188990 [Cryptomeria japonica]
MEKNGKGTGIREILHFGKRIQVGSENKGPVFHENENEKGEKRKNTRWTTELHGNFLRAIQQLGGPEKATRKQLMELMGVEGLTRYRVKNHLKLYRNAIKFGKNEQGNLQPRRHTIFFTNLEGIERKRDLMLLVQQGSFLKPHSKETCSTLQASHYSRGTTTCQEFVMEKATLILIYIVLHLSSHWLQN